MCETYIYEHRKHKSLTGRVGEEETLIRCRFSSQEITSHKSETPLRHRDSFGAQQLTVDPEHPSSTNTFQKMRYLFEGGFLLLSWRTDADLMKHRCVAGLITVSGDRVAVRLLFFSISVPTFPAATVSPACHSQDMLYIHMTTGGAPCIHSAPRKLAG